MTGHLYFGSNSGSPHVPPPDTPIEKLTKIFRRSKLHEQIAMSSSIYAATWLLGGLTVYVINRLDVTSFVEIEAPFLLTELVGKPFLGALEALFIYNVYEQCCEAVNFVNQNTRSQNGLNADRLR